MAPGAFVILFALLLQFSLQPSCPSSSFIHYFHSPAPLGFVHFIHFSSFQSTGCNNLARLRVASGCGRSCFICHRKRWLSLRFALCSAFSLVPFTAEIIKSFRTSSNFHKGRKRTHSAALHSVLSAPSLGSARGRLATQRIANRSATLH